MKSRAYVGYQIFPDRFFSSGKKENTLDWNLPVEIKAEGMHQYDFYGGDLKGIEQKIDYIKDLGIDFLYLTPVFKADTNHRYDCTDFFQIDPMLGTEGDFQSLADKLHENNIRLVLDGVFNHVGNNHKWYRENKYNQFINRKDSEIMYWAGIKGLPELNLDNHELRDILWNLNDSVVQKWTALGVDDWRLDCAYDVGYDYLKELTASLKKMGDHNTVGEIWSYPKKWITDGVLDGVMNYYFRELVKSVIENRLIGKTATRVISNTIKDCGIQSILRCWNVMSSHDTARIKKGFGEYWQLAVALQFTLPGSPLVYYGEELGLNTVGDPYCRQPMPWEIANAQNSDFLFYKSMIKMFNGTPALHSGHFGSFEYDNENLIAFSRYTEDIKDYRVIVVNPTDQVQEFQLISDESSLMNATRMVDEFSEKRCDIYHSMLYGFIEPHSFRIFRIEECSENYSPYKRL